MPWPFYIYMQFKHYQNQYYEQARDFLITLNEVNISHINWNWARLEWMSEHPYLDKSHLDSIGLWFDENKIVGLAIYDQYFGEAFVGVLPEYRSLYPEVLDYAYHNLSDENGLSIAICDDNVDEINMALKQGFKKIEQDETMLSMVIQDDFPAVLPKDVTFVEVDSIKDDYALQWLFYKGFDHGDNKEEFEKQLTSTRVRKHMNPDLCVVASNHKELVGINILWYDKQTDYAYLEPLCVIPEYRHQGVAKALVYENINRVKALGAKKVYVLSDMSFYKKLGFSLEKHFSFYHKN